MIDENAMVTVKEAAIASGVSERTVWRLIKDFDLTTGKRQGDRETLVRHADVSNAMKRRRERRVRTTESLEAELRSRFEVREINGREYISAPLDALLHVVRR